MLKMNILEIKTWMKKNNVADVILFGSSVRSNIEPRDIDLCILIQDSEEKNSLELIESLNQLLKDSLKKYHLTILKISSFLSGNTLAKTLFTEGYSVKYNIQFSEVFGFESKSMFHYNLKHYTSSKRVQFHYLLRGRYGNIGILKETHGQLISNQIIIIPTNKEDLLKRILDQWRVKYKITRILSA